MASKNELLFQLSQYNADTLERLTKYADQILIPDADLLTSVTMNDMIIKANLLADIHFPSWTDRSKADFGAFLVEIFAWFSEKDFWYMNAWAAQQVMGEVSDYDIAYQMSVQGGKRPDRYAPAFIKVQVSFDSGSTISIPAGSLLIKDEQTGIIYSNYEGVNVTEPGSASRLVTFIQGTLQSSIVNFGGDIVRILQERAHLLSLKIGDSFWSEVDDFSHYSESSKVYGIIPEETGFKIIFGDGSTGLRPTLQQTIRLALYTSAQDYSIPTGPLLLEKNTSGRFATFSFIAEDVAGIKKDSFSELRFKYASHRQTGGVIIRPEDLEALLEAEPDIVRAVAYTSIDVLYFFVVPLEGVTADTAFLAQVQSRFQDKVVSGLFPVGLITTYVDLTDLEITVYVERTYSLKVKELEARNLISDYTNPEVEGRFKRNFFVSDFQNYLLARLGGATNIIVNKVKGVAPLALVPVNVVPVNLGNIIQHIPSSATGGVVVTSSNSYSRTFGNLKITVQYV